MCHAARAALLALALTRALGATRGQLLAGRHARGAPQRHDEHLGALAEDVAAKYRPQYARLKITSGDEVETLWQRPLGPIRGTVFAAHGCNHQATDYFAHTGHDGFVLEACTRARHSCLALPEEVRMRRVARARGYLFVAVTSKDRRSRCWGPEDVHRVQEALAHVRKQENATQLPLIAFGGSSGGYFVGELALAFPSPGLEGLSCLVPQVSAIAEQAVMEVSPKVRILFVGMSNAQGQVRQLQHEASARRAVAGGAALFVEPAAPVTADLVAAHAGLLEGSWAHLAEAGARCTPRQAGVEVASALADAGLLDRAGRLRENPRESEWRRALEGVVAECDLRDTLMPDESPLSELMNALYSQHECTSRAMDLFLDFCDKPNWDCASAARSDGGNGLQCKL